MAVWKYEDLPHYVYDDYEKWEGKWEIIFGIPYSKMPSPDMLHQKITGQIIFQCATHLENCSDLEVILPIDFKISEDTVVQPDVSVLYSEKEDVAFVTRPPIIIFEILSDSSRKKDINLKYRIYEQARVNYYVIVDPVDKTSSVFQLDKGAYKLMLKTESGEFDFNIMPCPFKFDFGKIW
jgi:Uma2 family endonuclease